MDTVEDKNLDTRIGTPTGSRDALLATIPFVLFGFTCMLIELELPIGPNYAYLSFSILISLGIVIGLVTNFPLWTYSYLGWAVVIAWMWSKGWLFLGVALALGLLVARSLQPLRQMIRGIRDDWTLLSFMMYTFVAFTMLIYDESHHPYLGVFMLGSTLAISLGAWFYLRNTVMWKKLVSLFSGFVFAYIISYVCYATWDWAAYHGFPKRPPEAWHVVLRNTIEIVLIWSVILFWPAIIGLVQRLSHKNKMA